MSSAVNFALLGQFSGSLAFAHSSARLNTLQPRLGAKAAEKAESLEKARFFSLWWLRLSRACAARAWTMG